MGNDFDLHFFVFMKVQRCAGAEVSQFVVSFHVFCIEVMCPEKRV